MKKRIISLLLITVFSLGILTSCTKEPQEGGSFTTPIENDPVYLDPQIATDKGAFSIINNCFEGLVREDKDGNIISGVATDWSVSDDGLNYTFNLRQDAKWFVTKSAGKTIGENYETDFDTAITADDFIFALRRAVSKTTNSQNANKLLCIKNAQEINSGKMSETKLGVKKDGDYVLKIKLEHKSDEFLSVLTTPIAMPCNEEFFELTAGRYGLSSSYLIYNGPFYISNWNENTSVTIKKNADYHGDNTAKPASVFFSVNTESETRPKKLTQGTYDFATLSFDQYNSIKDENDVSFLSVTDTLWGLVFNCKDDDISCKELRLAICYGFDKSLMEKSEYMTESASKVLPPSVMESGEIDMPSYNATQAEKYWDKALDKLEKSGLSITIKCTQEHENQLRSVLQNLQKTFGISCDARVSVVEETTLKSDISSGNYQIAYAPIKSESGFAEDFLKNNVVKATRYENGTYNSLINKAQNADNRKRTAYLEDAQKHLTNNAVLLPVFYSESYFGINTNTQGIYVTKTNSAVCFINAIKS